MYLVKRGLMWERLCRMQIGIMSGTMKDRGYRHVI